jgi:hypothetical protein
MGEVSIANIYLHDVKFQPRIMEITCSLCCCSLLRIHIQQALISLI